MKIALLADPHVGARDDSVIFNDYFIKFFSDVFFPYLKQHNITTIILLGDVFDRRKYANFRTLATWNEQVFPLLAEYDTHIILGNHDVYYKDTNLVNSVDVLLSHYNFTVYRGPEVFFVDDLKILLLPWINKENYDESMNMIENSSAQICIGHLEIQGFEMHGGHICNHGLSASTFKHFDCVFSGHFHHKSQKGNISYLGSPYPMNWGDFGDERGFHIFDTDTREIEFIKNPNQIFYKLYYDDENSNYQEIVNTDYSHLKDKYIKVIVKKKTNAYWFDLFLENLNKCNPSDVSVVESIFDADDYDDDDIDETKDTFTILKECVDTMDLNEKKEIVDLLHEIYIEAMSADTGNN